MNSVDRDFSTPIVLALKNKRINIVKMLLDYPKTCLKQSSMKYGTPLHVAVANHEFKLALKILRMTKDLKDYGNFHEINRQDEEGNTVLHLVMRNFNVEPLTTAKLASSLIKKGCSLKALNGNQLTPMHVGLYYAQNEAIKFALCHNYQTRRMGNKQSTSLFDFQEQQGKLKFSPLHYAVYQNNFTLLMMILNSEEELDLFLEDAEGRKAIDLCTSISSIFKALRRHLDIQRRKQVAQNTAAAQSEREATPIGRGGEAALVSRSATFKTGGYSSMHLQHMALTHHCVHRRAILSNETHLSPNGPARLQQQSSTTFERKTSAQNSVYQSAGLLETFAQNPLSGGRKRDTSVHPPAIPAGIPR